MGSSIRIKAQSYLHVVVQFTAIFYLLISDDWFQDYIPVLATVPGLFLGIWSAWFMRKSVLTVFPDPDPRIILITSGVYKFIRHPMYTSLFLVLIPLVIIDYSIVRAIVLLVFTINQIVKLLFEEKLLLEKLPDYKTYKSNSWRLIPLIF